MGRSTSRSRVSWPHGKSFAFSVFDDPDFQRLECGVPVYDFLTDLGFRTTKGVWPGSSASQVSDRWGTCADPAYLDWVMRLQTRGFEIGWHGASPKTSRRSQTIEGFNRFRQMFGHPPRSMSQHYSCHENLYWGDERLSSGPRRLAYNLLTRWKNHGLFRGHVPHDPHYWADIAAENVTYVRNFVFGSINTLASCPDMPYHDPSRPEIKYWFASAEGHDVASFTSMLREENLESLEAEGGACIMYTHFAYGFMDGTSLDRRFRRVMESLSRRNGWFVPVSTLLDHILEQRGPVTLGPRQLASLERRWLVHKARYGSA